MISRRQLLAASGVGALGALPTLSALGQAGGPYRALVVVFLDGGNDGHNLLVPTDAAYNDYQASRANLSLSRASLVGLPGTAAGHTFGLHPALAPLVSLYEQRRLAFIANVGPLAVPSTARQVLDGAVTLPPFLLAHPEQVAVQQGWMASADNDSSGWAGRGLEMLPSELQHPRAGLSTGPERTLVLGRRTPPALLAQGMDLWGSGSLLDPSGEHVQDLTRMARNQYANAYRNDYVQQLDRALKDSAVVAQVFQRAKPAQGDFGNDTLSGQLRSVAMAMPVFKSMGLRRQSFLVTWGAFDTHAGQRGPGPTTQDTQLPPVARALAAFDAANLAAGLSDDVITLVMSEFGRTLRPSSGGGSEHAWGNHWMLFGGPVTGGTVHGTFPTLTLGGPDDGDPDKGGRFVPTTATDQVAFTLMQWMGLPATAILDVFPSLANFGQKQLPLLRV